MDSTPTHIRDLKPDPENARRHGPRNVGMMVDALHEVGAGRSIVIDENGVILAGNGIVEAAGEAGIERVQVVEADGNTLVAVRRTNLTPEQKRRLALYDNRAGELAEWDDEVLKTLQEDGALDGLWSEEELAALLDVDPSLDAAAGEDPGPQIDRAEELRAKWGVEVGQLWQLGSHRILCGDSTKAEDVARVMNGEKASWCWTDPPWNVAYGSADHPSWKSREILNDNLGDRFPEFCRAFVAQIKSAVLPGAMLYMAMSAQEWPVIDGALRAAGFHWSSTIIWKKDRLVLSRKDYHTQFEPVWYGWDDRAARLCPLDDRTQSDVWEIERPSRSDEHPTMKPVPLVSQALRNSSRVGDLGYEPFAGSGTTLVGAEQTGRRCYALELDPKYVAVTLERWSLMTGKEPSLA